MGSILLAFRSPAAHVSPSLPGNPMFVFCGSSCIGTREPWVALVDPPSECPMNCGLCQLAACGNTTSMANCINHTGPGQCTVCDDGAGGLCGSCNGAPHDFQVDTTTSSPPTSPTASPTSSPPTAPTVAPTTAPTARTYAPTPTPTAAPTIQTTSEETTTTSNPGPTPQDARVTAGLAVPWVLPCAYPPSPSSDFNDYDGTW